MPINTILVHTDRSPGCAHRVRLAVQLAQRLGARLIGVGLGDDDLESAGEGSPRTLEEDFQALLRDARLQGEWRPATGLEDEFIARQATTADLVVVGQLDPTLTAGLGPEGVIVSCGRPVLVVPCATPRQAWSGDTVLIAWNASREATRAVYDAQPLLALSKAVIVLAIDTDHAQDWGGRGLAHDLVRRGCSARAETMATGKRTMSETILLRANELGADLIVMGAYRRSPLGELFFGGLSHAMLRDTTIPLLMTH